MNRTALAGAAAGLVVLFGAGGAYYRSVRQAELRAEATAARGREDLARSADGVCRTSLDSLRRTTATEGDDLVTALTAVEDARAAFTATLDPGNHADLLAAEARFSELQATHASRNSDLVSTEADCALRADELERRGEEAREAEAAARAGW